MENPDHTNPSRPSRKKIGFWRKLGGGSLTVSLLVHVGILTLGAVWIIRIIPPPKEKLVDFIPAGGGGSPASQNISQQKQRASIMKPNLSRISVSGAASNITLPEMDDSVQMPTLGSISSGMSGGLGGSGAGGGRGHGFGKGFGSGFGTGTAPGGFFGSIPSIMRKRCSPEDRLQRLTENGGNARCEEAVIKGLQWLKSTQAADGSWGNANKPAMTGLALLCYLGHCETPLSAEFGESCLKAITYLVNRGMSQNGRLNESGDQIQMVYEHSIATYALAEASTFCKQLDISIPNLTEVTQQAGQYIIDHQHRRSGGWDYGYADESPRGGDLSVTAWQIQALKACSHTGIPFKRITPALRKSIDYVAERQGSDGGFGYVGAGDHATKGYNTLTGAGVLALQMAGKGGHASVRSGTKYIEERTKFDFNTEFADLYGHYYEAQAMMNRGGEQWKKYNSLFRDQLLDNQNPNGSWKSPGGGQQIRAIAPRYVDNEHYRNCLCILMLETYYRFLPGTGENTK